MNESAGAGPLDPVGGIADALVALRAAWSRALGGAPLGRGVEDDVDAMSDAGMLAVNDALAVVARHTAALHARVAAGIANRSRPELGKEGLARKSGYRTPGTLIAAATGGHPVEANRLIQVGEATTGRLTFTGHRAPAKHPHIAAGIAAGTLSVDAAAAIATLLDRVAMRVDATRLADAERALADQATHLTLTELNTVLRHAEAWLDPDGLAPRIEELHAARSLHIRQDASGMILLNGKLDPETGAPVIAAISALVTTQLRTSRGHNHPDTPDETSTDTAEGQDEGGVAGARPVASEARTIPHMQADALADLCRHALSCDETALPLTNTTVIVRIPLDALVTGTGTATIDGIDQPIDAGTARRMAGNAEIIPCVLGKDSEILDFGRTQRLFSKAQKLALVERDGGCAFCGLPPQHTEGHHIRWWDAHTGETNLNNLILLCTTCHHLIHTDDWKIHIDPPPTGDTTGGTIWFTPPPHIDPQQTPRIGGRKRFHFTLAA
jgi:hypothetical protein